MSTKNANFRCPVCHMDVDSADISCDYLDMFFVFCARQCQERFISNPHLYIGQRGIPAPKQRGEKVFKRRTLKLAETIPQDFADAIIASLDKMMGIMHVKIEVDTIEITYDLLEATLQQIEKKLEETGYKLASGWGKSLKWAFVHYLEETELDNLEHGSGPHCHH